jgi:hypothetical protein
MSRTTVVVRRPLGACPSRRRAADRGVRGAAPGSGEPLDRSQNTAAILQPGHGLLEVSRVETHQVLVKTVAEFIR